MIPTLSFPSVLDNTMRKAFVTCPMLFYRKFCQNLRSTQASEVDLHFGRCFAAGLEAARKQYFVLSDDAVNSVEIGLDAAVAAWGDYTPPPKHVKTVYSLQRGLKYYFEQFPLEEEDWIPVEGGIECSFAIEIPVKHPETGLNLKYGGRYDKKATNSAGLYAAIDEKTTKALGSGWMAQWDLDSQMTGYIWSIMHEHPGVEVMGIIRAISILTNDFGHLELPILRSQWMIDEWYATMVANVEQMVACYKSGNWMKVLNSNACAPYNRACEMTPLCMSQSPELKYDQYKIEVWSPVIKE